MITTYSYYTVILSKRNGPKDLYGRGSVFAEYKIKLHRSFDFA